MAAARPKPQKNKPTGFPMNKTARLPPPKRGKIKARIFGNLVKAVVSMVKAGDQGKKMATEAGGSNSSGSPSV